MASQKLGKSPLRFPTPGSGCLNFNGKTVKKLAFFPVFVTVESSEHG